MQSQLRPEKCHEETREPLTVLTSKDRSGLPWADCYHASFDTIPIRIPKIRDEAAGVETYTIPLYDTVRHGHDITKDFKRKGRTAQQNKHAERSTGYALPSPIQSNATLLSGTPTTGQSVHSRVAFWNEQDLAVMTVGVSFDMADLRNPGTSYSTPISQLPVPDPSQLLLLQSEFVKRFVHLLSVERPC